MIKCTYDATWWWCDRSYKSFPFGSRLQLDCYVAVKHPNRHVYANKFCLRSRSVRISEEYFTPTSSVKSVSTWRPHAHTGSIFCTSDHRSWYPPVEQNEKKIDFYPRYHVPPTITCGLTGLDIDHDNYIHIKAYANYIRRDSFYIHL